MRKITNDYAEFKNNSGIDVYYNDLTCYITIARGNNVIYAFHDSDTWETAVKQIVSMIQKY